MRKAGRQSKGTRAARTLRVPLDHMRIYEEAADERGLEVNDYLAVVLAQVHDLPQPTYVKPKPKPNANMDTLIEAVAS